MNVSRYIFALGGLAGLVACTNDEDLGGRDSAGGNYAAKAADLCARFPDHRLNWDYDDNAVLVEAKPGTCAERTKCLDSSGLDPAVAAKALTCLEADTDKNKSKSCKEDEVANTSATRALVTSVQNAQAKKVAECPTSSIGADSVGVWADSVLEKALTCFDKPCGDVNDCLRGFEADLTCIDRLF